MRLIKGGVVKELCMSVIMFIVAFWIFLYSLANVYSEIMDLNNTHEIPAGSVGFSSEGSRIITIGKY